MNETEYPKTETITKGEHTCNGNARGKKREKERELKIRSTRLCNFAKGTKKKSRN